MKPGDRLQRLGNNLIQLSTCLQRIKLENPTDATERDFRDCWEIIDEMRQDVHALGSEASNETR